ncbi:hypothetical protein NXC24_PB00489 (plasmid) [Rhizobium sp. NXC24]|nr:hypothetical protein NXC24_PB00489 [Rhizobium sp. NXC24]
MTTDQNLMLHTKLSGFRLVVLANRFGCDTEFSRALHDRLIEGLDAARVRIRTIMALERSVLAGDDEYAAYRLAGENEMFERVTINLLDELEIDFDTHEYRIQRWQLDQCFVGGLRRRRNQLSKPCRAERD